MNFSSLRSEAEAWLLHTWTVVRRGFPLYGLSVWWIALIVILSVGVLVLWNLTGKGRGSHAGREEIRRQYRRELARQMARQDAQKILAGTKRRRWWYKW